LLKNNKQ